MSSKKTKRIDPLEMLRKRPLAKLLNVNPWTVDAWRRNPRINFPEPIVLSPQVIVWRRRDVETWLAERAANPTPARVINPKTKKTKTKRGSHER